MISMKSALLTGEPSLFYMDGGIMQKIASLKGVKSVSPQLFLTSVEGTCCVMGNAFIIGFNPKTDFTVLPWLEDKMDRPFQMDDVIIGATNSFAVGDKLFFYGQNLTVYESRRPGSACMTMPFSSISKRAIPWPKNLTSSPVSPP
jgi:putative ABC transport system permease protein